MENPAFQESDGDSIESDGMSSTTGAATSSTQGTTEGPSETDASSGDASSTTMDFTTGSTSESTISGTEADTETDTETDTEADTDLPATCDTYPPPVVDILFKLDNEAYEQPCNNSPFESYGKVTQTNTHTIKAVHCMDKTSCGTGACGGEKFELEFVNPMFDDAALGLHVAVDDCIHFTVETQRELTDENNNNTGSCKPSAVTLLDANNPGQFEPEPLVFAAVRGQTMYNTAFHVMPIDLDLCDCSGPCCGNGPLSPGTYKLRFSGGSFGMQVIDMATNTKFDALVDDNMATMKNFGSLVNASCEGETPDFGWVVSRAAMP
ncbi:MAG: hypothetical protein ACPG4T_10560 [Nannocystaceae bacterium]